MPDAQNTTAHIKFYVYWQDATRSMYKTQSCDITDVFTGSMSNIPFSDLFKKKHRLGLLEACI